MHWHTLFQALSLTHTIMHIQYTQSNPLPLWLVQLDAAFVCGCQPQLSSVINGTQSQAERRTVRTISILNGHYFYKSPIALMDNRQGLDTVKVAVCTFCSNISACFWSEGLINGEFRNAGNVENVCYSDQLYEWLCMVLPNV